MFRSPRCVSSAVRSAPWMSRMPQARAREFFSVASRKKSRSPCIHNGGTKYSDKRKRCENISANRKVYNYVISKDLHLAATGNLGIGHSHPNGAERFPQDQSFFDGAKDRMHTSIGAVKENCIADTISDGKMVSSKHAKARAIPHMPGARSKRKRRHA